MKMASKVLILMTFLLALALLMTSSQVPTATAETTTEKQHVNEVSAETQGRGGYNSAPAAKEEVREESAGKVGSVDAVVEQNPPTRGCLNGCARGCCSCFRGRCVRCC